ncbi:PIN-like domain-containing protein [Brevibacterium casei]
MSFPAIRPEYSIYTDEELKSKFNEGSPIYFDTNILRWLWRLHTNPRKSVYKLLSNHNGRIFLPYQTQYEIQAQAYSDSVMNGIPNPAFQEPKGMLQTVLNKTRSEVDKVRPQGIETEVNSESISELSREVEQKFEEFINWYESIERQVVNWLGEPIDVQRIKRGEMTNGLLDEAANLFLDGHMLGDPGIKVRKRWIEDYEERMKRDEPIGPGKTDQGKPTSADSAGDYLMWQEILNHCEASGFVDGFFFVTEEKKADIWEYQQGPKSLRRIDPAIQKESIARTGGPMLVIDLPKLLELASPDKQSSEVYDRIIQDAEETASEWTLDTYKDLLDSLANQGYDSQHDVIIGAARREGYISRSDIGEILGWNGENRYLTRFRVPADRVTQNLIDYGDIDESVVYPLTAMYDGPGEAVGYSVPLEFVEFQSSIDLID